MTYEDQLSYRMTEARKKKLSEIRLLLEENTKAKTIDISLDIVLRLKGKANELPAGVLKEIVGEGRVGRFL